MRQNPASASSRSWALLWQRTKGENRAEPEMRGHATEVLAVNLDDLSAAEHARKPGGDGQPEFRLAARQHDGKGCEGQVGGEQREILRVRRLSQRKQHRLVSGETVHRSARNRGYAFFAVAELHYCRFKLSLHELGAYSTFIGRAGDDAYRLAGKAVKAIDARPGPHHDASALCKHETCKVNDLQPREGHCRRSAFDVRGTADDGFEPRLRIHGNPFDRKSAETELAFDPLGNTLAEFDGVADGPALVRIEGGEGWRVRAIRDPQACGVPNDLEPALRRLCAGDVSGRNQAGEPHDRRPPEGRHRQFQSLRTEALFQMPKMIGRSRHGEPVGQSRTAATRHPVVRPVRPGVPFWEPQVRFCGMLGPLSKR